MSRTTAITTFNQLILATGGPVLYGTDAGGPHFAPDVVEQLNWSFANRPQNYWCGPTGGAGWGDADSPRILGIKFDAALGDYAEKLFGYAKIDKDNVAGLVMGVTGYFAVGETGTVKLTLDDGTSTLTKTIGLTDADNGLLVTDTLAHDFSTSPTGTWSVKWEVRLDAGVSAANELLYVYLVDQTPFAIPEPENA
jgi:hypothetical protein